MWAVALGNSGKQTYSEFIHQRMCLQMGSVTAGYYCSVRVRTQKGAPALPQLTLGNVLDVTKLCSDNNTDCKGL